jgi:bifunctional oligoribonuclease and PAP phosphatase NrnA
MGIPAKKQTTSPQDIQKAWQLIEQAKSITILSHQEPDGDAVGACTAMSLVLDKIDKKIETIYPTKPEYQLKLQSKNTRINNHTFIPKLILSFDAANYKRLYFPDEFKNIPLINVDHHISNTIKGTYNFVNPQASSACEELFFLLKQWCPKLIDKNVAAALLFGILYDSQVFHTQSTTSYTLRLAAELMDYGVDLFALKNDLLSNKNPQIVALWGKLLSSVTVSSSGKAVWICITQADLEKFRLTSASIIGFNNFLSEIAGIDVTIVFYETEAGLIKVSLRSKESDVNALAARFGGGGHTHAAGITLNEPMATVIEKITKLV